MSLDSDRAQHRLLAGGRRRPSHAPPSWRVILGLYGWGVVCGVIVARFVLPLLLVSLLTCTAAGAAAPTPAHGGVLELGPVGVGAGVGP